MGRLQRLSSTVLFSPGAGSWRLPVVGSRWPRDVPWACPWTPDAVPLAASRDLQGEEADREVGRVGLMDSAFPEESASQS